MTVRSIIAALALCFVPLAIHAADNDDFNPYKNAKVGDFATYKATVKFAGQSFTTTSTQSVAAKTDKEATVKVTASINGMDFPAQEQKIDLTKPYDPTKSGGGLPQGVEATVEKLKSGTEKVKVLGKEYDSNWATYKVKGKLAGMEFKGELKAWMSKDIVMGLAKMEMTAEIGNQKMEMTMEVSETGNKK